MTDRLYKFPHVVTRWRKTGSPDIYGKDTYTVTKFPCRYQQTNRLYVNEFGQNQRSRAYIYTVDNDLQMGDLVIKGDYTAHTEPVEGAFEVKVERHHSNLRGTREEHRYIL